MIFRQLHSLLGTPKKEGNGTHISLSLGQKRIKMRFLHLNNPMNG
jgi:hypothetical protein